MVFFLLICLQATINFIFQSFDCIITVFLRKSNSFIIFFKDKVSDFTDKDLFTALGIFMIYIITYRKTQKLKKLSYIDEKIA